MSKYTGLQFLEKFVQRNPKILDYDLKVPSFFKIDQIYFEKYKEKKLTEEDLSEYFSRLNLDKKYIIRSNASLSEDTQECMGAGIYESIEFSEDITLTQFLDTLIQVYDVYLEKEDYRKERGIEAETFEPIVQELAPMSHLPASKFGRGWQKGYANSRHPHSNNIIYIEVNNSPILVYRDMAIPGNCSYSGFFEIAKENKKLQEIFVSPYDTYEVGYGNYTTLAYIVKKLEADYKEPVQIEFSLHFDDLYLYQIRPLPKSMFEDIEVEFPEEEPLFTIPFPFKKKYSKVYPSYFSYDFPNRFEFTESSYASSMWGKDSLDYFRNNLPEILCFLQESRIDHGHLQSIALQEKKLVLEGAKYEEQLKHLQEYSHFYVVADGKEMRFYREKEREKIDMKRLFIFMESMFIHQSIYYGSIRDERRDVYELDTSTMKWKLEKEFKVFGNLDLDKCLEKYYKKYPDKEFDLNGTFCKLEKIKGKFFLVEKEKE